MTTRWRPILGVSLGLLALDAAVWATADVWRRHSPDDYALRVDGCRRRPRDVVFVGGSTVSEGVIPKRIVDGSGDGSGVYAVGLPGGTTSEFYHAVKRACPTPPRRLVYGITASDLNDARHEPHGPASLMSVADVSRWAIDRPDSAEWVIRQYALAKLGEVSSLYRHRHGLRMWSTIQADAIGAAPAEARKEAFELRAYADALMAENGDGYAPAAGFVGRSYAHSKEHNIPLPPFTFLDRYRTGSHLKYLHKLVDWCEAGGTELVLVDMPVTADLETRHAAAFAEYRALLETVVRDRRVPLIRAHRDVVGITDHGFADTIHLNGVGAAVFSDWLKAQLERVSGPGAATARAQAEDRP